MTIGPILFELPIVLTALALLPVIWWLLRFTPPRPDQVSFPPIRLLLGLVNKDETRHKSPWWLTALRTLLAALVVFALAEPVYNPEGRPSGQDGRVLVLLDDTWAAAPTWHQRVATLETIANNAESAGRPVALVMTTPRAQARTISYGSAADLRQRIPGLTPRPFSPDRLASIAEARDQLAENPPEQIIWLSDGMAYGESEDIADAIASISAAADIQIYAHDRAKDPRYIAGSEPGEGSLTVTVRRPEVAASAEGSVRALALNGRTLGEAAFTFGEGETETGVEFEIPLALRNQIGRFEIVGERTAGAKFLLDDRWRRRPVGLVSGTSADLAQPLLSPLHYAASALSPFAQVTEAATTAESSGIKGLIDQGQSVLIVADIGRFQAEDEEIVADWIERGGILVRFAGPRLAANNDGLIPVQLRRGGRALGGALSWSKPQTLGPFDARSPFFGLEELGREITVERQVLAEPSPDLSDKVWARLEDGTPLVTAEARGNGLVVLFHVPASPVWSNLPLSGLFVEMMRRIVDLSKAASRPKNADRSDINAPQALPPVRVLNGFGELVRPPVETVPISSTNVDDHSPTPAHPPGIYGRDQAVRVINTVLDGQSLVRMADSIGGTVVRSYRPAPTQPMKGPLLTAAMILLLLDAIAVFAMSGRLIGAGFGRRTGTAAIVLACALTVGISETSRAQNLTPDEQFALEVAQKTHLAYVVTGDSTVDNTSYAGLFGLSEALAKRTALEPGQPKGVDLERDDITFFPILYWPMTDDASTPSDDTLAKIDAYMKNGGTIFFDTRDQHRILPNATALDAGPGTQVMRRILSSLDIPPLEVIPADHVLTKAFYLLQSFPGRWAGGQLWVEATNPEENARRGASNFDGVSSIVIGSNDFASAWATDTSGRTMFPVVPGGERQREMAYRTGINIVMYALTGNYKADQVHVPALLERLGQ